MDIFRKQADKFDLITTNMAMPNMIGVGLPKELMKIRLDIPIILCTGFNEMVDENRAKEMGINAFVMKPFATHEITNTIRDVLAEK